MSTVSNWIGVQTGVHGFDSRTQHKPVVSKTSKADIWLSNYDHMDLGKVDKQGECKVASYRYLEVSNLGKWLGAMSVMFPVFKAPGPHSSISEEFLHFIILRPKKPLGRWNFVNPLLSMNETWKDECAARLQPLVDQYKLKKKHQTFAKEKFRDLIVTTRSCKKISF